MADHTSGVIALVPAEADAMRLAVGPDGEPKEDLHLTLVYLGDDVTGWSQQAIRDAHLEAERLAAAPVIAARVVGHAQFNPDGGPDGDRDPCAVYLVGDTDRLAPMRDSVTSITAWQARLPEQHEPFLPHITAGYNLAPQQLTYTGPITFDRVRVALADDVTDYPLADVKETTMADDPDGIPVTFPALAVEGINTSDGRYIEPGALTTRPLPFPILAQIVTPDGGTGHDGAHVIGRVDHAERVPGPTVVSRVTGKPFPEGTFVWVGRGHIDPDHEAANLVRRGYLTGNSVDLSEIEAFVEDDPDYIPDPDDVEGMKIGGTGGQRMRMVKGTIAATTLVAIPAFADASVLVDGQRVAPAQGLTAAAVPSWRSSELGDDTCLSCVLGDHPEWNEPLTAAAVATLPPVTWFRDPGLAGPTPLCIDDDGRVYGHLATWGTCHTSYAGRCVLAPRSTCDYAYFRTGAKHVLGDNGEPVQIGIGKLTVVLDAANDGHAGDQLGAMPAAAHYDNAATAVADVEIGEDAHGVWVAGAVRPGATREQVAALMASTLSGDWRPVNGRLELVAALGVNVGGFPIPRARVASGRVLSLVAAGAVRREPIPPQMDALADAVADKVLAKLGARVPKVAEDASTDELAARKAAVLKAMQNAELAQRANAALASLADEWEEFAPTDEDLAELAGRKTLHIPPYMKRIEKHLRKKGMTESHAIATAVNAAKKMCATGDVNFPGKQQVNPGSRAEACAAVAQWKKDRPGAR